MQTCKPNGLSSTRVRSALQDVIGEDLTLCRGEVAQFDARRPLQIHCHKGRVWLTQAGDPNDYLLSPGEMLRVQGRGPVVVQAMEDAQIATLRL